MFTVRVLGSTRTIEAGRSAVEGSGTEIIGATLLTLLGEEDLGRMWGPAASGRSDGVARLACLTTESGARVVVASPDRGFPEVLWSGGAAGTSDTSRSTFYVGLSRSARAWKIDESWVLLR